MEVFKCRCRAKKRSVLPCLARPRTVYNSSIGLRGMNERSSVMAALTTGKSTWK